MPKVIWKGHINFGLVTVPVRLYSATERQKIDFQLIDRRDHSPVGYQKINKETGREVRSKEVARAARVDGETVIVEDEEFDDLRSHLSRTIDIEHFVRREQIQPAYYEKPYYLEPQEGAERSYALLREVVDRTGRVGVARVVLRRREHLAAVGLHENALSLNLLRFGDEVRDPGELTLPERDLRELGITTDAIEMATELVARMTRDWDPERYENEYRKALRELIEQKARPEQPEAPPPEASAPSTGSQETGASELTEQLRRSIDRGGGR